MTIICKGCGEEFISNRRIRQYCSRECANIHTGTVRAEKETDEKLYTVWSCGGGVQSTAIAVLIESGRIPKPDYGIMVNCGYEKSATLKYVNEVTIPRMEKAGVKLIMLDTLKYTNNDLTDGKGHINIPAFKLREDGIISKLHTHCNNTWKVRVTRKWAREQGINNFENWLGISTDEKQRARTSTLKWIKYTYPLIDLDMNREECIFEIARAGWAMPPRTSCIFCPQQTDKAWEETYKHYPDDWAKALEAEGIIRAEAENVFLHRKCAPLKEIFG